MHGLMEHPSDNPVGVALFGVGRMGQVHVKHLVEHLLADIVYLVDAPGEKDRVQRLIWTYHLMGKTQYASIEDADRVMADDRVKAVFVCTPTEHHELLIEKALHAGKHVFTEKPVTFSVDKARQFYQEASARGIILFCAFNRRHDPGVKKIKKSVSNGEVGNLLMIKICNRDPPSVCSGAYLAKSGDIFHDSTVHGFDMVSFLTNEMPQSLVAFGHAHEAFYTEIDDVDSAAVMLKFPSGLMAILENSRKSAYGYDQRLEVAGTKGVLILENPVPYQVQSRTLDGTTEEPTHVDIVKRYHESYKAEVGHFLEGVVGLRTCEDPDGSGAILALRLADLSTQSLKSGQVMTV
ncbi:inositol 2-dehydrogenase-like [Liolophura sinensis]|uniref:inositol 2-dehydrogenase-like n=1 Tax=Liolophura sinensis TaxID=3198878 RepID=UPI0031585DA8